MIGGWRDFILTDYEEANLDFPRGPILVNVVNDNVLAWWHHVIESHNHITGPLLGESTGHRWIPLTKCQ